ncbi:MAG TPA: universal stress protein [Azospirillum sp.]|nr:universal stress protein [Azospirillum sp.]
MKKLLVASDLSRRSDRAVSQAAFLAGRTGAQLIVLHVVDDELPERVFTAEREQALESLRETTQQLAAVPRNRLTIRIGAGLDFQTILATAHEEEVDLIILGAHRRHIIQDVFTGTTVERVIRNAKVPVLVAKRPSPGAYLCTLAALDLIEEADMVLRAAHRMADGQTLYAIHILDDLVKTHIRLANASASQIDYHEKRLRASCEAILNSIAKRSELSSLDCLPTVGWGSPAPQLLEAAQEYHADLVVVGTRTHAKAPLERFLLGSVAEALLRDIPCDVLAVPLPNSTPLPEARELEDLD